MDDAMKASVEARAQSVDTLGNLTLITGALSPSLGNAGWAKKREKPSGFLLERCPRFSDRVLSYNPT